MADWILDFTSLGGTHYRVAISGCSGNVGLIGSVDAFVTQEEDSDDIFTPVRLQSGYIRIADNGKDARNNSYNWDAIIPASETSHPVTLYDYDNHDQVKFRGYVTPQTYGGQWHEYAQIREIPVMCQLSALQSFNFEPEQEDTVNFGYLLYKIFSKAGTWGYFHFQGGYVITELLYKRVMTANLFDTDDNGNLTSKYSALGLLEEICKFWGWSCRTFGEDVYFYCPDEQQSWAYIDLRGLGDIGEDLSPNWGTEQWESDGECFNEPANNDNQILYYRGIRKATVRASVNPKPSILNLNFDDVEEAINAETSSVDSVKQGDTYYFDKYGLADGYENEDYSVALQWDQGDIRARFYLHDEYTGDIRFKHNYNWKCFLFVNDGGDAYAARFTLKRSLSLEHCVIDIQGATESVSNGSMTCRLRIGSYYWDGGSWTTTPSTFLIRFGNEETPIEGGGSGVIICNRPLGSSLPAYEGHGIPIYSSMSGEFVFDIVTVSTTGEVGQRVVRLTSFGISTKRFYGYSENVSRSENTYTANAGIYSDDKEVSTIFATDNGNQFGLGLLLNPDGSYCTEVTCDGLQQRPEQFLADRMARWGNHVRRSLALNLRTDQIPDISPLYYILAEEMSLYPLSISHQWADDITILGLYEV
jgi:hypothetical protein